MSKVISTYFTQHQLNNSTVENVNIQQHCSALNKELEATRLRFVPTIGGTFNNVVYCATFNFDFKCICKCAIDRQSTVVLHL